MVLKSVQNIGTEGKKYHKQMIEITGCSLKKKKNDRGI